jgi:hypothetical protein
VAAVVVLFGGVERKPKPKSDLSRFLEKQEPLLPEINTKVGEVSGGLLMMHMSIAYRRKMSCLMSHMAGEASEKLGAESPSANIAELLSLRSAVSCAAYESAETNTQALVETAVKTQQKPEEAYLFYRQLEQDDEGSCTYKHVGLTGTCEEVIGLFPSREACKRLEDKIRETDVGTRSCRKWTTEPLFSFRPINEAKAQELLKSLGMGPPRKSLAPGQPPGQAEVQGANPYLIQRRDPERDRAGQGAGPNIYIYVVAMLSIVALIWWVRWFRS